MRAPSGPEPTKRPHPDTTRSNESHPLGSRNNKQHLSLMYSIVQPKVTSQAILEYDLGFVWPS